MPKSKENKNAININHLLKQNIDLKKGIIQLVQINNYQSEQIFFLSISVRLGLNLRTTKLHVKAIHTSIIKGQKTLSDYSIDLQKIYKSYLEFLNININI